MSTDVKRIEHKLEVICAQMSQLVIGGQSPVTGTDAHHGASIISELQSVNAYFEVDGTEGEGPAILTATNVEDGLQVIESGLKEEHLVALYTPFFQEILDEVNSLNQSQLKLVNSECFTWLQVFASVSKNDLKPDLFIASHENVLYKAAYANAPSCQSDRNFGKFEKWKCRDSLNSIWDAKTTLNNEGKGKVFRYVQIAGQECKNHNGNAVPMRGVAFDAEKMMLITGLRNKIHHAIVLRMAGAGSRQILVDFLRNEHDEWAAAVRKCCTTLEISLGIINVDLILESQILLGAGGHGRAYRLEEGALKISLGRSMNKEYELMLGAYSRCPSIVVKPLRYYEQTKEDGTVLFSAYTMEDCGQPVENPTQQSLATALFYLHDAGLVHGDARLENIVKVGSSLKWIDFYESFSSSAESGRRHDVNTLVRSVCGEGVDISISDVNAYAKECTFDKLKSLMKF
jgi:hypothetical protein